MKIIDNVFEVSNKEIKMLISIYVGYCKKDAKLKPKKKKPEDNDLINYSILVFREAILAMVSLITSKLVGKLEDKITELKKKS
jgi:hypothetical protein